MSQTLDYLRVTLRPLSPEVWRKDVREIEVFVQADDKQYLVRRPLPQDDFVPLFDRLMEEARQQILRMVEGKP